MGSPCPLAAPASAYRRHGTSAGVKGLAPCQLWAVVQDEVLAHRLGLVPLKLDPELFQDKAGASVGGGAGCTEDCA